MTAIRFDHESIAFESLPTNAAVATRSNRRRNMHKYVRD
jgi:hypothetical protein